MKNKIIVLIFGLIVAGFVKTGLQAAAEPFVNSSSNSGVASAIQPHRSAAEYWTGVTINENTIETTGYVSDENGTIGSIVLSHDNSLLIAYGSDSVTVLDWLTGRCVKKFSINSDYCASFSTKSKRLLITSPWGNMKIFNTVTGELISEHNSKHTVAATTFSPGGNRFAIGSADGNVYVYELKTGKDAYRFQTRWVVKHGVKKIQRLDFQDEETLIIGKENNRLHINFWNVKNDTVSPKFKLLKNSTYPLIKGQQIRRIVGAPGEIIIQDEAEKLLLWLRNFSGGCYINCSNDMTLLAVGFWDGIVLLYNLETGRLVQQLRCGTTKISSIAFSDDSKIVAASNELGLIKIWRTSKGK